MMRPRLLSCPPAVLLLSLLGCGGEGNEELWDIPDGFEQALVVPAPACSAAKVAEVVAPATAAASTVRLDCSLTLSAGQTVTKRVLLSGSSASGVTLDCNGGTLQPASGNAVTVQSVETTPGVWARPEGATVRRCRIVGAVRVLGMGPNGEAEKVRASSRTAGHTKRAQDAAPKGTQLLNVTIIGGGGIPLYLSPGVTFTRVADSTIGGTSTSVGVYLDAESGFNTLINNTFQVDTETREQVALDGSANNKIFGNRFNSLSNGGIYLYRNCGEGGTARHQNPHHNQILANIFYYNRYEGPNPSVWLGSREGGLFRFYCQDDAGVPFGSSADNRDFVQRNTVADNQIFKRRVSEMIKLSSETTSSPNYLSDNASVITAVPRLPGCPLFLPSGRVVYLRHGTSFAERSLTNPALGTRYTCNNNVLSSTSGLATSSTSFSCAISDNNNGCSGVTVCSGKKLIGLRASCHLEANAPQADAVAGLPWDVLRVRTPSDNISDGHCALGGIDIRSGQTSVVSLVGASDSTSFGCREHDQNGGDCVMQGEALCL